MALFRAVIIDTFYRTVMESLYTLYVLYVGRFSEGYKSSRQNGKESGEKREKKKISVDRRFKRLLIKIYGKKKNYDSV